MMCKVIVIILQNAKQEAAHNWTATYKHLLKPNISSVIAILVN